MFRAFIRTLVFPLTGIFCAAAVQADEIALSGKPPFRSVQITDCRGGKITFRGASGEFLRKPLRSVEWLACERLNTLTEAELAARSADWEKAIASYIQALGEARDGWLHDLARARLVAAYDRAGMFDQAVERFLEIARADPQEAVELTPYRPGPAGSTTNAKAIHLLNDARRSAKAVTERSAINDFLLALLLYEDAPLPPEFVAANPVGSQKAKSSVPVSQTTTTDVSGDENEPPPLFGTPLPRTTTAVARVKLTGESLLISAARIALENGDPRGAAKLIERGLPFVPRPETPAWRLVLGRARIELGEFARAADELVGVAESDAARPVRDEALYYAGLAHERLGRPDVAARLYDELLARGWLAAELRATAQAAAQRVKDR